MALIVDKHYEEEFELPLWTLIQQRAREKNISYSDAWMEVMPEFQGTINYADQELAEATIRRWNSELAAPEE